MLAFLLVERKDGREGEGESVKIGRPLACN